MPSKELIEMVAYGDRTQAEALRIAYDRLKSLGWKFTHHDVGRVAKEIIEALNASPLGEQSE
ncbi:hypothetical protein [Brucella pituitosa]|uniref:Uncharacterized protein n=1 Tax=Brucella pituitosa TaxID=571256 RepID=A0A643EXI7_9HYPH|nr:hypothetical protein [Brucella pituitosa]KAB0570625.1 hypothetical protein F7Q93_15435 [Brucella pituitosa]